MADDLTRLTGFQKLTNQSQWRTGPAFFLEGNIKSFQLNVTKTASITFDERINHSVQLDPKLDKINNK